MKTKEQEIIYDKEILPKIKINMAEKVKRNTLSFFFVDEPYTRGGELVMTKWSKEADDVVDYDRFFKEHKGPWKEFENIGSENEKYVASNKVVCGGCII